MKLLDRLFTKFDSIFFLHFESALDVFDLFVYGYAFSLINILISIDITFKMSGMNLKDKTTT